MDAALPLEPTADGIELSFDSHDNSTGPAELERYLQAPEGTRLEFKEAKHTFSFEKLVQYVVALANEGGGKIVLGVTDTRPRRIVGTQAFTEPGRLQAGLFERLRQRVPIEETVCQGARLLVVHVPGREAGCVWEDSGVAWSRAGDALVPMGKGRRHAIYLETGDFSSEVCPRATLADLDREAITDFRGRWAARAGNPRLLTGSDARALEDAELLSDGKPTYAALILFGTRQALGRHLPQAEVIFEYRSGDAPGAAQARIEYREGFLRFRHAIWDYLNLRNDQQGRLDGFFRIDIPTFDEAVVREAILNAVCHREYRIGGSIFVRQYPRRLEVISPGGLPMGVTAQNILDGQRPRNRRLAESFARCGLVERAGQGMDLIFERTIRDGKPLPDFSRSDDQQVFLTLDGTVIDGAFARFLAELDERKLPLSARDLVALYAVRRGERKPPAFAKELARLRELGIVDCTGRGRGVRYELLKDSAGRVERSCGNTPEQGPQRTLSRNAVMRCLRDYMPEGCSVSEIHHVVPALSRRTLQRLLRELQAAGTVRRIGAGRGARWLAMTNAP